MTPELAYFLKANIAFVFLYGFYRLFFYKDTFFTLRRGTLLAFYVLAFSYPLFNLQEWIKTQEPIAEVIYAYSAILPEITIEPEVAEISWVEVFQKTGLAIYLTGAGLLFLHFLIQLVSILRLAYTSRRVDLNGITIYEPKRPTGPFSFFHLIFVSPDNHTQKELDEILIHEHTHASEWHSIDVIISELMTVICWINPFAWLLKREVRHNLEYLADNTVLQSGYDSKTYQYHLLGLANHKAAATIYNSFNVLNLKNRISMMNKKRSHKAGMTKYLIFLPIAALLMLLSNMEAVARLSKSATENIMAEIEMPVITTDVMSQSAVLQNDTSQVFTIVEEQPRFPGGEAELLKFLNENMKYPEDAKNGRIQGRVICSFIVNKDGTASDVQVTRGVHPSLDAEAVRVLQAMPRWTPGKQKGEVVRVRYNVPVVFRLQTSQPTTTQASSTPPDENTVFTIVDVQPSFPGGDAELLKFLAENMKYPEDAQENGVQGRVTCSFIVNTDGTLSDISVLRGVHPSLDAESVRVLQTMPKWVPGKQRGQAVRVSYSVPLVFRLQ